MSISSRFGLEHFGAAKALLMDSLTRKLNTRDESVLISLNTIVDEVLRQRLHRGDPDAIVEEVVRRLRRKHLRVIK